MKYNMLYMYIYCDVPLNYHAYETIVYTATHIQNNIHVQCIGDGKDA